jgi:hypothetical protein
MLSQFGSTSQQLDVEWPNINEAILGQEAEFEESALLSITGSTVTFIRDSNESHENLLSCLT